MNYAVREVWQVWCGCALLGLLSQSLYGQTSTPADGGKSTAGTSASNGWLVRDPASGRVYEQRLQSVVVPVTKWQPKVVEQTIYEAQYVTQVEQVPQTLYTPTTQYVMQPRLRGWWNPLRQPTQAYDFVPVTTWTPQVHSVSQTVTRPQWVAKPHKTVVYEPVQSTQTQQQIVQREVPQPAVSVAQAIVPAASSRPPFISIPLLAQQRVLPWAPVVRPASVPTVGSGLRPVATGPIVSSLQSNYSAPMRTASVANTSGSRDSIQAGMAATILR